MAWRTILAELEAGRRRSDSRSPAFFALATDNDSRIYCQPGCSNCCALTVNCSFPEALAISRELTEIQRRRVRNKIPQLTEISRQSQSLKEFLRRFRQQLGGCPFLSHSAGCCGIYPQRPFSCRALLSTRNRNWCAIDFTDLHPLEQKAFLSGLERELVAFPTHYLAASRQLGLELEAQAIAGMRETFSVALSGNLIYQVWLEQEYRLSAVIAEGLVATRAFLAQRQLERPFLLLVEED